VAAATAAVREVVEPIEGRVVVAEAAGDRAAVVQCRRRDRLRGRDTSVAAAKREPPAGRPRLTYEVAPKLDYTDIVSLFAAHLGGTAPEREQRALRIGADLAHRVHLARKRDETTIADLVVATLSELGFQVRSALNSFGEVTVQICTCPLAEVAATAPEVVRGIQQGLIQEVIDLNADAIGGRYRAAVTPDVRGGSCEVSLVLRPG
jgi:predicted ArsR family transcriptional regulator